MSDLPVYSKIMLQQYIQGEDMVRLILSAVISIILIIGGLSGQLVFRGTNSSGLLAAVGFFYLIYDIYKIIKYQQHK